ncbi:MAG: trypsin-like peptidase domain-containing protein [Alicyclobacillaceae bacterium]|nr:trypsin-like peptidase domain-containing protein [Alicyclobacillaceae bacterium]
MRQHRCTPCPLDAGIVPERAGQTESGRPAGGPVQGTVRPVWFESERKDNRRQSGAWKWLTVSALSAAVGSACTLAAQSVRGSVAGDKPAAWAAAPPATVRVAAAGTRAEGDRMQPSWLPTPAAPSVPVAAQLAGGIVEAVKKVEPAVMGVVNYAQVADFFTQETKLEATGVGTGVLFHKDGQNGYLVTNNHVVEGAARVEVVMGTGKHVRAAVVGTDRYTDLAVLRVPLQAVRTIQPAEFANSNAIQVGEPAIAIGTPLGLDFADSVTAGIVSAKKRIMPVEEPQTQQVLDYQAVIQTDAAINPGNSGGPLCNIRGQVIGINSSKIVAPNFEGMGFAIPSNEVRNIANQLMRTGHALHPALGIAGYSLATLPEQWWPNVPVDYGVWVKSVTSAAAKQAGLEPQDVIVGIDGHDVKTMADLRTYLFEKQPGQDVTLRVYRGSRLFTARVKLGQMKSDNSVQAPASDESESDPFAPPDGFWN